MSKRQSTILARN